MAKRTSQVDVINAITVALNDLSVEEVNGITIPEMTSFLDGLAVKTNTRNTKANASRSAKTAALNEAIWAAIEPMLTIEPHKAIYFAEAIGTVNDEVVSANRVARLFTAHSDIVEKVAMKKGGCGYRLKVEDTSDESEDEDYSDDEEDEVEESTDVTTCTALVPIMNARVHEEEESEEEA